MLNAPLLLLSHLLLLGTAERIPRLKFRRTDQPRVEFGSPSRTSVEYTEQSDTLYLGATGGVYLLRFTNVDVSQTLIPLSLDDTTRKSCHSKGPPSQDLCENVVTVIQRVNQTTIIICGTHAGNPKCWFLTNNGTQLASDKEGRVLVRDGKDISPSTPSQRPITIAVGEDLYSAISSTSQNSGSIQRSYGRMKHLKSEDRWFQNPTFVGSAWIQLKDSNKDEVYFFFRETNDSIALDGEPYRAYIGRVCKIDEGGSKTAGQDLFSTFLKARLICGFPAESRLFNKIEDAFVLHVEDDQRNSVVYGIFSSLWNSTAVCAYYQADIERAFRNSRLKGFTGNLPGGHWPGMCVKGSAPKVIQAIRNFPEIEKPIYPIRRHPLYVMKHNNYTRITADRVKGANQDFYHVIFLGTGNGKIHKVLHNNGKSFIISELSLFKAEAPVSTMTLDSSTGHLFVGTPMETVRLPLANCGDYGSTCVQCVAARDPYCGWNRTNGECVAVPQTHNVRDSEVVQNVEQLNVSVCDGASDVVALSEEPTELIISSGAYLYLPCPVKSYHAVYTWSYNQKEQFACTIKDDSCPLMFNGEVPMSEGLFKCTAIEDGLKEELAAYKVTLNVGSTLGLQSTALLLSLAALCSLL
ncbi:semaphorin-7A [Pristis pectinata]|uniref:semaphorin-7A n=1 Tax=Pristis pectinata TaxID=685728 RepID=UPI00223D7E4D|nr:semaphorin-7A [Pristis pectinata]